MNEDKSILVVCVDQDQRVQAICDIRNRSLYPDNFHFYFARNLDDARAILEAVDISIIVFFAKANQENDNRFFISSLRSLFRGEIISVAEERADRQVLLGTECDTVLRPDELAQAVREMTDE